MSKQLNVLEKEFLVKRFKERKDIKISDFCEDIVPLEFESIFE